CAAAISKTAAGPASLTGQPGPYLLPLFVLGRPDSGRSGILLAHIGTAFCCPVRRGTCIVIDFCPHIRPNDGIAWAACFRVDLTCNLSAFQCGRSARFFWSRRAWLRAPAKRILCGCGLLGLRKARVRQESS